MLHRIAWFSALALGACSGPGPDASRAGAGTGGVPASATGGAGAAGASVAGTNAAASGGQSAGSGGQSPSTGGGAGAGVGGQAGAGGGMGGGGTTGSPSLTLPIVRGALHVLELGALYFAVDAAKGARIVSFKLDGDELLTGPSANPNFYGSTLWTSPANDWVVPGTFVPPAVVDSNPYTTSVSADNVVTATSAPSTANGKQFVVSKAFHADLTHNAIVIDYGLKNVGSAAFRLSHWEVTRVLPGGLLFFPSGTTTKVDFLKQQVQVTEVQGYTWYDNASHVMGKGESKAGTDSSGGFVAQVAPQANGDLLFIKAFKGITAATAPPDHYPVEFYCNDPHSYVELEDHSSYDEIAPGVTYTQTVTWYLRRLPPGTERTAGNPLLISSALTTLGRQ